MEVPALHPRRQPCPRGIRHAVPAGRGPVDGPGVVADAAHCVAVPPVMVSAPTMPGGEVAAAVVQLVGVAAAGLALAGRKLVGRAGPAGVGVVLRATWDAPAASAGHQDGLTYAARICAACSCSASPSWVVAPGRSSVTAR